MREDPLHGAEVDARESSCLTVPYGIVARTLRSECCIRSPVPNNQLIKFQRLRGCRSALYRYNHYHGQRSSHAIISMNRDAQEEANAAPV